MGSEWSEEQAGPQGPAGPSGGTFLASTVTTTAGTKYSGSAEAMVAGATVSATLLGGFRYRLTAHVPLRSTVAGDVAIVRLRLGAVLTGSVVALQRVHLPVAGMDFHADFYGMYDHGGADGSFSFGLSCARESGAGTVSLVASSVERGLLELQQAITGSFGEF